MADHYDIGILPARPRKPRDKAKVEACVLIVERYLLVACATGFHGLAELNRVVQEMLADINECRPLRRLGVTLRQLFERPRPPLRGARSRNCTEAELTLLIQMKIPLKLDASPASYRLLIGVRDPNMGRVPGPRRRDPVSLNSPYEPYRKNRPIAHAWYSEPRYYPRRRFAQTGGRGCSTACVPKMDVLEKVSST